MTTTISQSFFRTLNKMKSLSQALFLMLFFNGYLFCQDVIFERVYGNEFDNLFYAIGVTSIGDYIAVGDTESSSMASRYWYIVKVNSEGDTLWTSSLNFEFEGLVRGVKVLSNDAFVTIGNNKEGGLAEPNASLAKFDQEGNMQWEKRYGGNSLDSFYDIIQTSDGGFVLSGDTYSFSADGASYLVRTDDSGNELWSFVYDFATEQSLSPEVVETGNGDLLVAGWKRDAQTNNNTGGYLIKLSATGELLWEKFFDDAEINFYSVKLKK